jgi:hypothetical protein
MCRRPNASARRWLGLTCIGAGAVCVLGAPIALVNGEGVWRYLLVGGAAIGWLGWVVLPSRSPLRIDWARTDLWGIPLREDLAVYVLSTAAFILLGFIVDWFWAAVITMAAYIAWFASRLR